MNIVCDICHQRTRQAPDGSQPICSPCLRSQRIASGIPVEPLPACPMELVSFAVSMGVDPGDDGLTHEEYDAHEREQDRLQREHDQAMDERYA